MRLLLTILILTITSCATAPKKKADFGPQKSTLTESYAQYRFGQIENVKYQLYFDLDNTSDSFSGVTNITFNVKHLDSDLRLDFHEGAIQSLLVNNTNVQTTKGDAYILIPSKNLKLGPNHLLVRYTHKYSRDGRGFHRFKDSEDGRVYTYTNLEPYKANRVFPCFDQPDLKATYTMKVKAPKSWTVITSVREDDIKTFEKHNIWNFPESQKFSTYIWSLHAGPYASWSWNKGKYPLRLFVRKSMAKYVKLNDWFPVTDQGFTFFEKYFGTDYPYLKYDQVIVPEFNSGAMENVAAVTFSERYMSKGVKTRVKRMALGSVILHEMAHMWFGNLVTMKWWNDLWLNESFATYTAAVALARATEFKKEAWHDFNGDKSWAYWEDQLPTTHPIEAVVPDTQQAFANFDGITYGKGAASLKLLHYNIGDSNFQKGLDYYFKKFAEKNTVLSDFVGSLEKTSGKDLKDWRSKWLQTASLNTVKVNLSCSAGLISSLSLEQSHKPEYPVIRPHSTQVALFNIKNNSPVLTETHKISFSGKKIKMDWVTGKPCPDIVYPNYGDYAYFKSSLNQNSINNLVKYLPKEKDSHLRDMYLKTLWEMVRDGELGTYTFARVYKDNLKSENNGIIFNGMRFITESLLYYLPKKTEKQQKFYNNYVTDLESISWKRLRTVKPGSEVQKSWYKFFNKIARTPTALKRLDSLLAGRTKLRGFEIDQDKRWGLIQQMSRFNYSKAKQFISKEEKRDKSSSGVRMALISRSAIPNWESKIAILREMTNKNSKLTYNQFSGVARNIFPNGQEEFRQKYKNEFFTQLLNIEKSKESHYPKAFARLGPDECSYGPASDLQSFLNSNKGLKSGTIKRLKISISENKRCRKVKEVANSYSSSNPL